MASFLPTSFFERDVLSVARDLIGVELVWQGCSGLIVETEAYAAEDDPACHVATRPSARDFLRTEPPGAAYVYLNYGMHWLFNLHVKGGPRDGLILIRALEPKRGIPLMEERRARTRLTDLCSGPGKLAQALGILGSHHRLPLTGKGKPVGCGLKEAKHQPRVLADLRIGISQAKDYPWRFLAEGSPHVSVPPRA